MTQKNLQLFREKCQVINAKCLRELEEIARQKSSVIFKVMSIRLPGNGIFIWPQMSTWQVVYLSQKGKVSLHTMNLAVPL